MTKKNDWEKKKKEFDEAYEIVIAFIKANIEKRKKSKSK